MQKKVPFSLFGKSKEKLAYLYLTYINIIYGHIYEYVKHTYMRIKYIFKLFIIYQNKYVHPK